MGSAGGHLHAETVQVLGNEGRRAELAVGKLWMGMYVPAPGNDLGLHGFRSPANLRRDLGEGAGSVEHEK
jgi:hypothetical protein